MLAAVQEKVSTTKDAIENGLRQRRTSTESCSCAWWTSSRFLPLFIAATKWTSSDRPGIGSSSDQIQKILGSSTRESSQKFLKELRIPKHYRLGTLTPNLATQRKASKHGFGSGFLVQEIRTEKKSRRCQRTRVYLEACTRLPWSQVERAQFFNTVGMKMKPLYMTAIQGHSGGAVQPNFFYGRKNPAWIYGGALPHQVRKIWGRSCTRS